MNFSILWYANDIVLVAEKEIDLQKMLNIMSLLIAKKHRLYILESNVSRRATMYFSLDQGR